MSGKKYAGSGSLAIPYEEIESVRRNSTLHVTYLDLATGGNLSCLVPGIVFPHGVCVVAIKLTPVDHHAIGGTLTQRIQQSEEFRSVTSSTATNSLPDFSVCASPEILLRIRKEQEKASKAHATAAAAVKPKPVASEIIASGSRAGEATSVATAAKSPPSVPRTAKRTKEATRTENAAADPPSSTLESKSNPLPPGTKPPVSVPIKSEPEVDRPNRGSKRGGDDDEDEPIAADEELDSDPPPPKAVVKPAAKKRKSDGGNTKTKPKPKPPGKGKGKSHSKKSAAPPVAMSPPSEPAAEDVPATDASDTSSNMRYVEQT